MDAEIAMTWRRLAAGAVLASATLGGCSVVQPNPDCRIGERCEAVLATAGEIVPLEGARIVVRWGRGPSFHAEVHVCHADGRNTLVDVIGSGASADLRAGIRDAPWDRPPCR